jgi:hypothetical protein
VNRIQHVGICAEKATTVITTVDGNTSVAGSQSNGGAVCRRTRALSNVRAVYRPPYEEEDDMPSAREVAAAVWSSDTIPNANGKGDAKLITPRTCLSNMEAELDAVRGQVAGLVEALGKLASAVARVEKSVAVKKPDGEDASGE